MKSLRWGLIAAGNIAARFAKGLATTTEADVVAVGARSRDRATQFARAHGIERAYGSYAEVLADPDVDAVYISTQTIFMLVLSLQPARASTSCARSRRRSTRRSSRQCWMSCRPVTSSSWRPSCTAVTLSGSGCVR